MVVALFFDNLGRNKRWDSHGVPMRVAARPGVSVFRESLDVSLRQLGVVQVVVDGNSEATWSYMVKRISAYGGCLGGQRR